MEINAWSRSLTPEKAEKMGVKFCSSPAEVARHCSAVSVHLALTPQTRTSLGKEFFEELKAGEIFINTCRAEVVEEKVLLEALERGVLVGTDVFHDEPSGKKGDFSNRIAQHPNLYGTHHIGASTEQSESATGAEVVRILSEFAQGEKLPNCLNQREAPKTSQSLQIRHEDRVGILAEVMKVLKDAEISIQEMENTVFVGAKAANARIVADKPLLRETVEAIAACPGVYSARLSRN